MTRTDPTGVPRTEGIMKASRLYLLLLLAIAVSLVAAACGSDEAEPAAAQQPTVAPQAAAGPTATPVPPPTATAIPRPQGTLTFAWSDLLNFQGVHYTSAPQVYMDAAYDTIIGSTRDGKDDTVSGLATGWSMSPDGKVWTIKTRNSVVFHNGDKASAADVKAWLVYTMSEGSMMSTRAVLQNDIASLDSPDSNTAVVTLKARNIFWPQAFVGRHACGGNPCYVVNGDYLAKNGITGYNRNPVGSGPFKVKEIQPGNSMTYEATDSHWFWGVPRTKTIVWNQVPEENTQLALLRNGGADMINISRAGAVSLKNDRTVKIYTRPGGTTNIRVEQQYIREYPGSGPNPLADLRVRQAMMWYGIDRKALADTYMVGFASPDVNWPANMGDPSYEKLPVPPYDLNKAKQMIVDAGFAKGFELDMYIWPRAELPEGVEMMEGVAVMWEKLGIKVTRKPLAFATYTSTILAPKKFERPSVSGMYGLTHYPFAANQSVAGFNPANQFVQSDDQVLKKLADDWVAAASLEEYIRIGRLANKAIVDAVAHTPALLTFDKLLGGRIAAVPGSWAPTQDAFSFGAERIGLQPKTWTVDKVS
ncbi:MAG: ABC transporter substrate-binding protein [Dehalococcoidia bacterium]|nr:ABC transporter substrate-binding protein [Dehalococcoidia bacterium]